MTTAIISANNLLLRVLVNPELISDMHASDWDLLIRQARLSGLLAKIYIKIKQANLKDKVPDYAMNHLRSAVTITDRHANSVRWEIYQLNKIFSTINTPLILLKGAAYVAEKLPVSSGRLFFDLDLLVPKEELSKVEIQLKNYAWMSTHHDEYDQRYYRKWMHELPPLRHSVRQTVLDVHHAILPETARIKMDVSKLFESKIPVDEKSNIFTLSAVDMLLHSATHLFSDGELEHGLRDLSDLDDLMRCNSEKSAFWSELVNRATELNLQRPLFYAFRYTMELLETPVPQAIVAANAAKGKPNRWMLALMDRLFIRALQPDHDSCKDSFTGAARWMLYVRSHYLRMPLHLLIPHLFHKAMFSSEKKKQEA